MGQEIVIFSARKAKKSGSFFISKKPKRSRVRRPLGYFFLALSLAGIILFLLPIARAEFQYRLYSYRKQILGEENYQVRSKFSLILSPYDDRFELIIPKLGIKTQVFTDVDPANEAEYEEILKDNVAHAAGSNLPGEGGLVYIFGHSTNSVFDLEHYNPVFYLLDKLNLGDELGIIHQGKVYIYQVAEKKVVEADELDDITSGNSKEKLILQTCWPPGTTLKRLLVIAYPEGET